jgi:hypothetical protein
MTEIYSDLLSEPRLKKIIKFTAPPMEESPGAQGLDRKPATTTRTQIRKNIPTGGTQAGRAHVGQQAWLGQATNQDQGRSLTMPPA